MGRNTTLAPTNQASQLLSEYYLLRTLAPFTTYKMCLLSALGFLFAKGGKDDSKPNSVQNPANGYRNPAMSGNPGQYPMGPRPTGPPPAGPPGQAPPYR
ncbi:hypothetical protein N7540_011772 [Penicillium herquei]|nr:hypothetical protein N7540_011772 [Penicillium herquei]